LLVDSHGLKSSLFGRTTIQVVSFPDGVVAGVDEALRCLAAACFERVRWRLRALRLRNPSGFAST
jgi:hypothetical protein